MIELSSADREILIGLYASKSMVELYSFHERYLLSPGQISSFVRRFEASKLVSIRDARARLTSKGRRWVLKHRRTIFLKPKKRDWADAAQMTAGKTYDPYAPYMPALDRVDRNFFIKYPVDDADSV